jgi:hypothetical protein
MTKELNQSLGITLNISSVSQLLANTRAHLEYNEDEVLVSRRLLNRLSYHLNTLSNSSSPSNRLKIFRNQLGKVNKEEAVTKIEDEIGQNKSTIDQNLETSEEDKNTKEIYDTAEENESNNDMNNEEIHETERIKREFIHNSNMNELEEQASRMLLSTEKYLLVDRISTHDYHIVRFVHAS